MERHAVPQNIMEVEFKLFGALSVRQFAYLAGGVLAALAIYFTPLPGALRFVLIIISVLLGLFLSLIKINGQYSSVWLSNFIVAMFTSQERVWKKTGYVPDVFHEEVKKSKEETLLEVKKEGRIKASVAPLTKFEVNQEPTAADREEELRLKQIEAELFSDGSVSQPVNTTLPDLPVNNVSTIQNSTTTQEAAQQPTTIKGYVVNKSSKPVPSALVSVNTEGGEFIKEVMTDERGFFDLGVGLETGKVYFANIAAEGLQFDLYKIKLKPGQDILYKFTAKQ